MVVCQPGMTDVAKSMDTMVCTESTNGVEIPAKINDTISNRCQVFTEPFQPNDIMEYILLFNPAARSRTEAISGNRPQYQNTRDTVKYVEIAKASHTSGELKFTHSEPNWLGNGKIQYASQGRPMCATTYVAAQITAKIVIASAERLMELRQFWRKSNRTAEISVPACPIPTHHTKSVISHAQPTVLLSPQAPIPVQNV